MILKVASYNIHAGIGPDQQFNMHRVAAVINELDADVIALQEVEHQFVDNEHLLQFLAKKTGYELISGITFKRGDYDYGNVLLSRWPISQHHRHDLSINNREPRGMIEAHIKVNSDTLVIMAVHLGLRPFERRLQVKRILSLLACHHAKHTVLMGDINEWFLWGRPLRWLKHYFKQSHNVATFPARWPFLSLDKIWVSPSHSLLEVVVHRSPLASSTSDHLPILAKIQTNIS